MEKPNKVLSERELASELGLPYWTCRTMRLKEGCPHFLIGNRVFYRLGGVMEWIQSKEQGQQQESKAVEYGKLRRID